MSEELEEQKRLHEETMKDISEKLSDMKEELKTLRAILEENKERLGGGKSSKGRALPEATCRKEGGEFIWDLPPDAPKGKCKHCQLEILWVKSRKGFACPIDPDGRSHRDTCPERQDTPKPKASGSDEIDVPF